MMSVLFILAAYVAPIAAVRLAGRGRRAAAASFTAVAVVFQLASLGNWRGAPGPDVFASVSDFVWWCLLLPLPALLALAAVLATARAYRQR
jgi:cytochrome bd-type quinol oxidase subunit 2